MFFSFYEWYITGFISTQTLLVLIVIIAFSMVAYLGIYYRENLMAKLEEIRELFRGHLKMLLTGVHPKVEEILRKKVDEIENRLVTNMESRLASSTKKINENLRVEIKKILGAIKPHEINVLSSHEIIVPQKNSRYVPIRIDAIGKFNIKVLGEFNVWGGAGNDIRFYALNQHNFDKFRTGRPYWALDESGQVSNYKFEIPITHSGKVYLVFDNTFSILSAKTVRVNAKLSYESLKLN